MLVTLFLLTFCKEICILQCEILSISSFQDIVFPIHSFQHINQQSLLILFIVGNSKVDILFFQKKLPFMSLVSLPQPSWEHYLINICHSVFFEIDWSYCNVKLLVRVAVSGQSSTQSSHSP